ncbi:MAG: ATP-dependent Clp protease adaptor ClpS [Clostridium sp.]|jgi:ATP-dependent Clp protease adaptor protein ClpS|uniref:ATP-dependent Clp protease adaptor ClpS n=1 Tax=Clostridium sp. TaxID=1506 RepID=UPI0025BCA4F6|nr:ATP-dependent Clp protease adaptor ClpS [Clostridium sp.]MCH3963250.1 ATP-dependent Clp protease adaptor ClpS [Clostridium sp.]MCI1717222.1 ATP-dependent Clp protease adaptor ClpS [Clostridium sp.]MCI1801562.1 ATP-dependent Clp protease adaptor ClpS [Clostridium sp.]MCI1815408.1 ATP-dependent Clp protease adaptor ClpS [Clostridium sp.]MCI1872311.1 ATP-dependent Clp protease adaptor ClpS [Clostridium sp.]
MSLEVKATEDTKSKIKLEKPRLYKVVIYNDDYTTMNFVIEVLMKIFMKQLEEATRIMYDVHKRGIGIAGIYCYDIAQTKMIQAMDMAKNSGFPLKFSMEEE